MADIDLTYVFLANEETEKKAETPKIHDKKEIEPQLTDGVKKYYYDLGKNTPENEKRAMLEGVQTDYLFDELRRRFTELNRIIEGITSIVLNTEPVDVSPERIESLRKDFKQAEQIKQDFKDILK